VPSETLLVGLKINVSDKKSVNVQFCSVIALLFTKSILLSLLLVSLSLLLVVLLVSLSLVS
jgi:hypothetical protein